MVRRHLRTNTVKKVKIRTAKKVTTKYKQEKQGVPRCANCKKKLNGIPALIKAKFRSLTKSQRKVARKYGGNLCSACSRRKMVEEARALKLKK